MNSKAATFIKSPFLTIPSLWRLLIVLYLVCYHIFFPIIAAMFMPHTDILLFPRFLLTSVHVLLISWPLLFYRREYGFLHPLLLPTIMAIAEDALKTPLNLIFPLEAPLVDYTVPTTSPAFSLRMGLGDLAATRFWYETVQILALLCYYMGYFTLNFFKAPSLRLHPPRHLSTTCAIATALCIGVGLLFIQLFGGGLTSYLVAMRSGRSFLLQGQGQFLVIAKFSMIIVIVWFVYLRRPFNNTLWLVAVAASAFTTIVITGSRSSLISGLVVLLLLWWKRKGRPLVLPTAALAVLALLVFGIFGAIRMDWGSRSIDTSVFKISRLSDTLNRAHAEFEARSNQEGDLAAFAAENQTLLWGRSYLGAISFWIPRTLWHGKPHAAGAYNMWVNFAGRPIEQFGTDVYWGIPVGAATEAYWNFYLPGVVVIFLLFGAFHRWLSDLVWRHPQSPVVLVFSTWVVMNFRGDSGSFANTVRDILMLGMLCYLLGIFRLEDERTLGRSVAWRFPDPINLGRRWAPQSWSAGRSSGRGAP